MRLIATLTLALGCVSLAACQPPSSAGAIAATGDADLARAEAAYAAAHTVADLITPMLPARAAATVARSEATAEKALATARTALTTAERAAALAELVRATAAIAASSNTSPVR